MVMIERPVDFAVGEQEALGIRRPLEAEPERLADDAVGPIGADQVRPANLDARAGFVLRVDGDALRRLLEAGDLDLVLNLDAEPAEVFDQDRFDVPLRHHQEEGIGRIRSTDVVEVETAHLLAIDEDLHPRSDQSPVQELVGEAHAQEKLHGPGVDPERARLVGLLLALVENANLHAAPIQSARPSGRLARSLRSRHRLFGESLFPVSQTRHAP